MIQGILSILLAAVDPCAPVVPAPSPDPAAAAEYRAVAEAEQSAGAPDTAAAAWQKAAELDPRDRAAPDALAALCKLGRAKGADGDPVGAAIRLLDAGRFREAAELLRSARRTSPGADAALLEGISRYELGEDAEAARLLREAETDPQHRDTARLYLGLLALRGGSALEAASLFDAASGNAALAPLAADLSQSARWDGPLLLSLRLDGGWDSNVSLVTSPTGNGDAVAGLSAVAVGRPLGANGPFLRAAGSLQQFARLDAYDFTSWEAAAGWRRWKGGTGATAEYSFADRTLGGDAYLQTHRLLASGAVALGTYALSGSWWGRREDYGTSWSSFSGWAQRADGRVIVALGSRARLGVGWGWGRDDADSSSLSWKEHGPRADVRVVLGPRTRIGVEGGYTMRRYAGYASFDPERDGTSVSLRLTADVLDATAALEWDLGSRTTLRLSVLFRRSDSNLEPFDYRKVAPSAAIGLMMTP